MSTLPVSLTGLEGMPTIGPASTYSYQIPGYPYAYKDFAYQNQPQPPSASTLQALSGQYLTPNLPSWLIPVFGSLATIALVTIWPRVFFTPVVIGLIGIILLWLTQPMGSHP